MSQDLAQLPAPLLAPSLVAALLCVLLSVARSRWRASAALPHKAAEAVAEAGAGVAVTLAAAAGKAARHVAISVPAAQLRRAGGCAQLGRLLCWCAALPGARYVSVCDGEGAALGAAAEVLAAADAERRRQCELERRPGAGRAAPPLVLRGGGSAAARGGGVQLALLGGGCAQDDVAAAARRMCREPAARLRLGEQLGALRAFPDPDVLLVVGGCVSSGGYPPWQLRLTEFFSPRVDLGDLTPALLDVALAAFAGCEQREGR